jgi:hypothetical protein
VLDLTVRQTDLSTNGCSLSGLRISSLCVHVKGYSPSLEDSYVTVSSIGQREK